MSGRHIYVIKNLIYLKCKSECSAVDKHTRAVMKKLDNIWKRLAKFPDRNNHINYIWKHISDGYAGRISIFVMVKTKFLFFSYRKYTRIVRDIDDEKCIYNILNNNEEKKLLFEIMEDALIYLELREKQVNIDLIDFNVKFTGLQDTVKNILSNLE